MKGLKLNGFEVLLNKDADRTLSHSLLVFTIRVLVV